MKRAVLMRIFFRVCVSVLLAAYAQAQAPAEVPVVKVSPKQSTIQFAVKASVALEGTFEKWDATLTFTSDHVEDGVLDIKIQAASVNTGSRLKDDKLKSKDFFDAEQDPFITFRSSKIIQTGPFAFDLPGTFTIRGVSKPETLHFTGTGEKGSGHAAIKGTMAFDRKEFGMDSGIPFIRIADRVEVNVDLDVDRVGGPPLIFKR
jgi:polyisoprenoid-binding protein YceI